MDMLLFIYINTQSLQKARGDVTDYDKQIEEELQDLLLNLEDNTIPKAVNKDTQIVDNINQEELARLALPREFLFLELDIDVVIALYSNNIPDFTGDFSAFFDS
jgi:hypothetical protein